MHERGMRTGPTKQNQSNQSFPILAFRKYIFANSILTTGSSLHIYHMRRHHFLPRPSPLDNWTEQITVVGVLYVCLHPAFFHDRQLTHLEYLSLSVSGVHRQGVTQTKPESAICITQLLYPCQQLLQVNWKDLGSNSIGSPVYSTTDLRNPDIHHRPRHILRYSQMNIFL